MKFTTGLARLSYAHLFQPAADLNGNEKYSASFIFDKKDTKTKSRLDAAIEDFLSQPETQKILGKTRNFAHPLVHDGDTDRPGDDAYKGSYYINAKSNPDHKPRILNFDREEIVDPAEVYSGCYVQAVLNLYAYNKGGNKGIGASIAAVRKVRDGKPLTGATVTDSDFDDDLLGDMDQLF